MIEDDLMRAHAASGECPQADVLFDYAHGRLTAEMSGRVEAHVVTCGECELLSQSLRTLEEPDWDKVGSSARPPVRFRFARWIWNPLPAYVLALVLAVVVGTQKRPPVVRPASPPGPRLDVASLVHLAPDERGPATVPRVAPGTSGSVVFTFFIPVRVGATYTAQIVDSTGSVVLPPAEIQSADGGQFFISCPGSAIKLGSYRLLVTESGPETRTFQMSFTR